MDTCHWKNFPNLAQCVRPGRVQFAMFACCRHVLCYGKYSGPGPPASLEFTGTAAPDHTYCHFYDFQLRIPTLASKLPIIEIPNKHVQKCIAFVWFGTAMETV